MRPIRRRLTVLVGAVPLMLIAACTSSSTTSSTGTTTSGSPGTTVGPSGIQVSDVWCRANPPVNPLSACYMSITNGSGSADALVGASAPTSIAETTELHETVGGGMAGTTMHGSASTAMGAMKDDTSGAGGGSATTGTVRKVTEGEMAEMGMRPVAQIPLPPGQTVKLEPGGYHVMLINLVQPLAAGQTVPLTLTFQKAGTRTIDAPVRSA